MSVEWSHKMSTWTWSCVWGCSGWDHESQAEAETAFFHHRCPKGF